MSHENNSSEFQKYDASTRVSEYKNYSKVKRNKIQNSSHKSQKRSKSKEFYLRIGF